MKALTSIEATTLGLTVAGSLVVVRALVAARPRRGLTPLRLPRGTFWVVLGCFAALVYVELIVVFGINLRWLAFDDVYDVRSDFVDRSVNAPLIGSCFPLLSKVVNPIFIARGIYSRRKWRLLVGLFGQLLIYLTTGQKVVFLSIFGLIGVALLFRHSPRGFKGITMMAFVALSNTAVLLIDKLVGAPIFTNLLIRRFLVVPGVLTAAYVVVFRDRLKTSFAPFPAFWLESPYASPARLVGQVFVRDADTNANVSLFGHGYLSLGYIGILIECLVLVVMLWFADAATKGIPVAVTALIFFLPTIALSNSSVFTVITTHGFAATILLCVAMPRNGWGLPHRSRRPPDRSIRSNARVVACQPEGTTVLPGGSRDQRNSACPPGGAL